MKSLSESEFLAVFSAPMQRVALDTVPPFDFWDYFDAIPPGDFQGHQYAEGNVKYTWNDASGRFQHVLVDSEDKNIFMVLVLDLHARSVVGHRILNLGREYRL